MADEREPDAGLSHGPADPVDPSHGASTDGRADPGSSGAGITPNDHPAVDAQTSAGDAAPADLTGTDATAAEAPVAAEAPAAADAAPVDPGRTWYGRRRRHPRGARRKAPWWELPALVLLAVGIAVLVKSFVVQPFFIPSDSMEKTLHGCPGCHGDRILVNKPVFDLRDPHPGDIVVFHDPKDWGSDEPTTTPPSNPILRTVRGFGQLVGFVPPDGQVLVKRVIATGGQTVKGVDGQVSVKNPGGAYRTLNEPFVYLDGPDQAATFGPVTVPKGRLWVMGDHRNDSADSRFHCSPGGQSTAADLNCDAVSSTVPISDVIGKAFVIAWPPSRWRTLGTPATFTSAAQAAGPTLPGVVSLGAVVPVFLIRRRRRRL